MGRAFRFGVEERFGRQQELQREQPFFVRADHGRANRVTFGFRLAQDRLDAHGRVLQIGSRFAFEAREPFEIEDVVRHPVVQEIGEFDRGHAHHLRDGLAFLVRIVERETLLVEALGRFLGCHGDEVVEFHHAARARLERLAVGAVHRAVADMFELGAARQARLLRGAEHLLEMPMLTLIDDIENEIGIVLAHAVDDGREIGCAVQHRAVGLQKDQRRDFFRVGVLGDGDDQRTFVHDRVALGLELLDHRRDQRIGIGFAFPLVEHDAQAGELAPKPDRRDIVKVLPQRTIAGPARLQLGRSMARCFQPLRIGFAGRGSGWIHLLQIVHRDGRFFRIRTAIGGIEIRKVGPPHCELGDELSHLQAPIAEVHVARDGPAVGAEQPLQRVADDRGAQMSDMHRLGDVRPAEIDDDALALPARRERTRGLRVERLQPPFECGGRELDVDEARARDHRFADQRRFAQARGDLLGDRARVELRDLRRRERAVALEFGEVRAVGDLHLP